MTEAPHDRLREDFSYVRAAIERQRHFVGQYVPVWLAAVIGFVVIGITLLKDLHVGGVISQPTRETAKMALWVAAVILVLGNWFLRRKAPSPSHGRAAWSGPAAREIIVPWIIYAGGIVVLKLLADKFGLDHDAAKPFYLAYSSAAFLLIGYGRLNIIFGFGAALGLGTLVMYFLSPPFPYTWLGVLVETGLVAGAWFDHRANQARAGARA